VASPEHKRRFLRQGDPDFQAFHHDLYRTVGAQRHGGALAEGRWWVMEQQPGPVNWAPWNPDPLPGMARLWAHEAYAHGAEAVCYFRWRQAPFAQEQMHAGLLRPDSAPAPAYFEAGQVARELAQMPTAGTARARAALVFDYASAWAWDIQPQGRDFSYFRLVFDMYCGLRRLGLNIDILPPECDDLSAYDLVLAPGVATLSAPLLAALATYAGVSLIGPRSNSKTVDFAIPVPLPPNLPAMDAIIARVESLPPDCCEDLTHGGAFVHWREKVETSAEVVETTADGWPALIKSGRMHYLAGWADEAALGRILTNLCSQAGLDPMQMPEGVRLRDSATHRYLFNYNPFPIEWEGRIIAAAGVDWQPLLAARN
jgi:beta-galactosidase